jgi:hypothetical protein
MYAVSNKRQINGNVVNVDLNWILLKGVWVVRQTLRRLLLKAVELLRLLLSIWVHGCVLC